MSKVYFFSSNVLSQISELDRERLKSTEFTVWMFKSSTENMREFNRWIKQANPEIADRVNL